MVAFQIKDLIFNISGNIPINAGLSSSSALTVAWIQFLIEAFGIKAEKSPMLLAKLAYESEVLEQGSSGGKMDQFTIVLGNLIYMETSDETVKYLPTPLEGLIIGVSGVSKDTFGLLSTLKENAWKAINQVKAHNPDFQISTAVAADIDRYQGFIDAPLQPTFQAAISNHIITQKARLALAEKTISRNLVGDLMNEHHSYLRDNLHITVPKIDAMIDNALNAGALGVKIVGSGGGGCIVALASKGQGQAIIANIKSAGAKDAFLVQQRAGATIETYAYVS